MDEFNNRQVPVDEGDLSEALDAATAWAGYLRRKPSDTTHPNGYGEVADRIDAATARLRNQSFDRQEVTPEVRA